MGWRDGGFSVLGLKLHSEETATAAGCAEPLPELCCTTGETAQGKPQSEGRILQHAPVQSCPWRSEITHQLQYTLGLLQVWLVVWNMAFIFPFSWEWHHPNCYSLHPFSEG